MTKSATGVYVVSQVHTLTHTLTHACVILKLNSCACMYVCVCVCVAVYWHVRGLSGQTPTHTLTHACVILKLKSRACIMCVSLCVCRCVLARTWFVRTHTYTHTYTRICDSRIEVFFMFYSWYRKLQSYISLSLCVYVVFTRTRRTNTYT